MRLIGWHFVLGQTIEEALARAGTHGEFRYSFDMLGEGARTAADADALFRGLRRCDRGDRRERRKRRLPARPGISVKLSALHPRYEAISRERVLANCAARARARARRRSAHELNFTVDAEEADRLELSLEVIGGCWPIRRCAGWEGFGLAVQAYQKRACAVIDWLDEAAHALGRRLMVRLVKGAYWDTEIKRAQERGLADYPVFTRKPMTDLSYMACMRQLLRARPAHLSAVRHPQCADGGEHHRGAGGVEGYEFQRLHGMGEVLYETLLAELPDAACRVYAPVGGHRDLLAYLVRRLVGERRQLVLRRGRRRSERADRGHSAAARKA